MGGGVGEEGGEKGEEEGGKRRREMREDGGEEYQYKNGEDEAGTHLYWSEVDGLNSPKVMLTV